MSTVFSAILLASTIVFHAACEFFAPNRTDDFSSLYPFLDKWSKTSATRMLTVVFDDYKPEDAFDIPERIWSGFDISTRLVTLRELMSLKRMNMKQDYQVIESGSCVLLLFSDTSHLRDILGSPHMNSFWQPENFYILQERSHRSSGSMDIERFCMWAFERLWRFRRVYKLMLFVGDRVVRYDPFGYAGYHTKYFFNENCDWYCIKSHEDSFLMVNEPNKTDITDFFDQDRRNFERYPMKISIFKTTTMPMQNGKYGGMDYKYVEEISRMMNVTPILVTSKDRYGWEQNGSFFGTVGQLVYEFADASFNQFFIKDYQTRQLEFTAAVTSDKLCVLVPKALPVPDYLLIVKVYSIEAWLLIFTVNFAISLIYTTWKSKMRNIRGNCLDKDAENGREMVFNEFHAERSFVTSQSRLLKLELCTETVHGGSVHSSEQQTFRFTADTESRRRRHRAFLSRLASSSKYLMKVVLQLVRPLETSEPCFPERLLLMCSLCLSLILNGVFTSQLASSFSKRLYYEDIDTLEELEESGLAILTNSRDIIDDALTDATSPLIKRLHMRLQYANDTEIHRRLFESRDAGFLHRLKTLSLKFDEYQRKMLHVVEECPKEYILAFLITKGSPFRSRINSVLGRLNNGGFYDKWYQSMFHSQNRVHRDGKSVEHRKITMKHLSIPFVILYIGLTTSTIVFVCEYKRNNPR